MSDKQLLLKENSHKTQSKWSVANYLRREPWRGASENYSKAGRLFALTGRRGD